MSHVRVGAGPRRRLAGRRAAIVAAVAICFLTSHFCLFTSQFTLAAARQSPPRRIVSLVPAVTEMLFAIGAGSSVVGVSTHDRYPAEAMTRPKVGALIDPDVEAILALRPDMVVMYGSQDDLRTQMRRASVATFDYRHAGLADVTATIRQIGARVDHVPEAERLALSIERELGLIAASVAGRRPPRTALLFGREPGSLRGIYASAGLGFMHDMLVTAGGDDVFADVKQQSLQASLEIVLARAPDVIIETHPTAGWTPDVIRRDIALWSRLTTIPAVRNGRVYILAEDRLLIPGPRVTLAVRALAEVLHPEIKR